MGITGHKAYERDIQSWREYFYKSHFERKRALIKIIRDFVFLMFIKIRLLKWKGSSKTRPQFLNDSNYPYWKVRMKAFIKSQDEKEWRSILIGWSTPTEVEAKTRETIVKSELNWSTGDNLLSSYNNKVLHALFNGVCEGCIKLIPSCYSAKEAWKILQTQFERTADPKLIAIEETKDLISMRVEELMGSLQTFELNQQIRQKEKPNKVKEISIALKSSENSNAKTIKSLSHRNDELESNARVFEIEIFAKNAENNHLKKEFDLIKKNVKMLNPESTIFEEVQSAGIAKTPYEIWKGVFLGYYINSMAYRVYNMRTQTIIESANVVVDDGKDFSEFLTEDEIDKFIEESPDQSNVQNDVSEIPSDATKTKTESSSSTFEQTETQMPKKTITDPIHREPSAMVKKNYPDILILGDLEENESMTRTKTVDTPHPSFGASSSSAPFGVSLETSELHVVKFGFRYMSKE
ncbi:uncharacterized protein LOC133815302 [Humulus lupulus]|uniref:uncharacterized protein LOC133815302 n=1 Tax=Humulus lupulus TaxID=3486 RepID=UPI002B404112|nr:uncharacterized protein LOC133815302 [Humulus lupulus]